MLIQIRYPSFTFGVFCPLREMENLFGNMLYQKDPYQKIGTDSCDVFLSLKVYVLKR